MRNTTDKKKKTAIICASVVIGILAVFLATIIFPLIGQAYGELIAVGFLVVYGFIILAVIVGIIIALRQRLKEIEGGEEDAASKY